jgi:hypothetical protein
MIVLLAGCNPAPQPPRFCPIAVHANDQVHGWFEAHKPLPQYMRDYLKNIGDQQADIDKYCQ